ncbi:MAG: hypothetical protein LBR25_04755 [Erysipelotrichaceae bacterium]|jgi:hypothetical protein|nr:hypothetical protein [Erysipelotrichaceae bacterium]
MKRLALVILLLMTLFSCGKGTGGDKVLTCSYEADGIKSTMKVMGEKPVKTIIFEVSEDMADQGLSADQMNEVVAELDRNLQETLGTISGVVYEMNVKGTVLTITQEYDMSDPQALSWLEEDDFIDWSNDSLETIKEINEAQIEDMKCSIK